MRRPLPLLLLATAMLGGCENAVSTNSDSLVVDDARVLAAELDLLSESVLNQFFLSPAISFSLSAASSASLTAAPEPINQSINRSATCPLGGEISLVGTVTGTRDRATRTIETRTEATKSLRSCAVRGRGDRTITTSGSLALTAQHRSVNGAPTGLQIRTQKGTLNYSTSAGASGSCAVDITSSFDPATRTQTIRGTTCRRTIDITRTRS